MGAGSSGAEGSQKLDNVQRSESPDSFGVEDEITPRPRESISGLRSKDTASSSTATRVSFNIGQDEIEKLGERGTEEGSSSVSRSRFLVSNKWEGALSFLNHECCYVDQDAMPQQQVKRSMSFAAKKAARCKNAWRRLRAACMKRGRLRRLPSNATLSQPRNMTGEIVLSPAVQGLVLFVICLDVSVSIYRFFSDPKSQDGHSGERGDVEEVLFLVDWFVVTVLLVEVTMRMFFLGSKFTHSLLNLMELAVVPVAIFLLVTTNNQEDDRGQLPVMLRTVRPLLRTLNLLLKAARGFSRVRQFQRQLQLQVSGNRRRWRQDGFDLDLCYIIEGTLIAMGRPAIGSDAFYNNPLLEVAKFMDKRHCNRYLIINAGEKVDYPPEPFHQRVILFPVQAFSVPKLMDLWDLCTSLREFINREGHVVAVHSRLGGGRVGLVIVAYLLYSQAKRQAADAMSFYEKRLTEPFSSETVSGIDTASQQRFMEYFSVCVRELRFVPDPPRKALLKRVKLLGVEPEMASWLSVKCFAHSIGTAARSVIPGPDGNGSRKLGSLGTRSGSQAFEPEDEQSKKRDEEALLLIKDEDEILLQAAKEREAQEFDSVASGCRPLHHSPLFDTGIPGDPKVIGFDGEDNLQNEVVVWQIDNLEVAGEICFEIHRSFETPGQGREREETQLLLATWLHTSFLEMSQGSQAGAGVSVNNRSVCVTLQRFDMDKGANAPSLRSYGSSFEVQLLFEVDEVMQYKFGSGSDDDDDIARLTGRQDNHRSDVLRLQQPTGEDMSDSYRATWLTWGVSKLWPSIDLALQKLIKEELEPTLQALNTPMGYVHVNEFTMGTETPELGPITANQRSGVRDGLQIDIFMRYQGNANIVLQSGTAKVGVTQMGVNGTLSLLFEPIVHSMPIVGGLHIFFLNPPQVVLTFVGLADPLNLGVLKNLISNQVDKLLADKLVLPNVLTINWMEERLLGADPVAWLSSMLPTGVLSVAVAELEPITPAQWRCRDASNMLRCNPTQPNRYVILRLGAVEKTIELASSEQQNMEANRCYLLVFDNKQNFTVEVWEREPFGQDRLLGTSQPQQMTLADLLGGRGSFWVPLEAALGGDLGSRIRLKTLLFELHADKRRLPHTEEAPKDKDREAAPKDREKDREAESRAGEPDETLAASSAATTGGAGSPMLATAAAAAQKMVSTMTGGPSNSSNFEESEKFRAAASSSPSKEKNVGDEPVALVICNLIKGRVPLGDDPANMIPVTDFEFRVSVGDKVSQKTLEARDEGWMKEFGELSETTSNTIEELSSAGFPSDKIAMMLKIEEVVVSKVVAHRLGYNVQLPQHVCVMVRGGALKQDASIKLEVLQKGTSKAGGEVPLSSVWRSNSMRLRSLVELKEPQGTVSGQDWEADVELRIFAFVSHQHGSHRRSRNLPGGFR